MWNWGWVLSRMKVMNLNFKEMKKVGYGLCLLVSVALMGCDDIDKEPPKTDDITRYYELAAPKLLTTEERAVVQARKDEYNAAVKGN